jgi:hypothetical protein
VNGHQRFIKDPDHLLKKNPVAEHIYEMGQGWYTVRLPDRWVGVFFGIENAAKAKRKALNER